MGEMKRWGKVYEKLRISQAPLKYNFPSTLMVVILIFPNIKHICISKYKNVLYIYIYPPTSFPSFQSFPPTPSPRYQDVGAIGTQCAVRRLEGLLETGDRNPRFANLKLGGVFL